MSSPLPPDPYETLGVSKDAQIPEIRSAHRKLVLKCHPDKVQDPTLKAEKQNEFQKVQQAYEILSNEQEREKYDNQVKLAELRKAKANSSATRSSRNATAEYDVYYSSPRQSHRSSPSTAAPPAFKVYYSNKSFDSDDRNRGPRVVDAEPRGPVRRESTFADRDSRPSKRESEREARERDKDRERERDRERRKRAEREAREYREAKEAKEARRAEKRAKEKQQAKEMKHATEEKRRYMTPDDDIPPPKMEKKTSSSRKYEPREPSPERERRDEFSGYDEAKVEAAINYMNAARISAGGVPRRAKTYHGRAPYVPSPPPAPGVASAYPSPDEDEPRRSAATASTRRRGSADIPKVSREKSYSKSSRERLDEEPVPRETRPPAGFQKSMSSAAAAAGLSNSPPRPMARTNTMPPETTFSRPVPGVIPRAQTFTEGAIPRGRGRSKMEAQVEIESEDEDAYAHERERRTRDRDPRDVRDSREARDSRDRKHRGSKKHRSPDRYQEEPRTTHISYKYARDEDGGPPRAKFQGSYTRRLDPESDFYDSYGGGARYVERPSLARESSYSSTYSTPANKFPKVRTTKIDDVQYSNYGTPTYAM